MNPPFEYLEKQYKVDTSRYERVADLLYALANRSAATLAALDSRESNDSLVHCFYDLFVTLYSGLFTEGDAATASAIIDGVHFTHFGQPSLNVIESILGQWALNETCFLATFFHAHKHPSDLFWRAATAAQFSLGDDTPDAIETQVWQARLSSLCIYLKKPVEEQISAAMASR
ncbi:MAG: hypothetical protein ACYTEQ_28565 [Planctomycetota bacterium]|jgi:hypothetical protein